MFTLKALQLSCTVMRLFPYTYYGTDAKKHNHPGGACSAACLVRPYMPVSLEAFQEDAV